MTFKKGQSGNPAGRKPGTTNFAAMRKKIRTEEILKVVEESALAGDMTAARLLLERSLPALRPVDTPVTIPSPTDNSLADVGRSVLDAVAQGRLTPGEGSTLLGGIAQLGRVIEVDELVKRIETLEQNRPRGESPP